ncbi:MAG: tRNA (guanine-N7-)-methyltransferase [Flavobacteriales bacterium]|jgi:tRNA (guanine-N7-)-methyltransferase
MKPEALKKSIRSYVIRGGRITDSQKKGFDRWWPNIGLSLHDGRIDLREIFPRPNDCVLEIGFGMGDSLFEMASVDKDKNFIGVEVHPPGMGRIIHQVGLAELDNFKAYLADAKDVLEHCIPDESLERVQIYFPDPWHKKKHNKRRIVQTEFMNLIVTKIKPGGTLHLATDWENYAEYMMAVLSPLDGIENCAGPQQFSERPEYRPITKFEKRGTRLGHGIWDIIFRRL